jgi:hypothetical protein
MCRDITNPNVLSLDFEGASKYDPTLPGHPLQSLTGFRVAFMMPGDSMRI